MEHISNVFTEGLLHRLLPMLREKTLHAVQSFTPDDYMPHAVAAGLGALLASAILYAVGIWLRRLPKKISTESQQQRIEKLRGVAAQWLPYALFLAPAPFGNVLIIAAGFFAIRPWIAAVVIIAAEVAWRASPLL